MPRDDSNQASPRSAGLHRAQLSRSTSCLDPRATVSPQGHSDRCARRALDAFNWTPSMEKGSHACAIQCISPIVLAKARPCILRRSEPIDLSCAVDSACLSGFMVASYPYLLLLLLLLWPPLL